MTDTTATSTRSRWLPRLGPVTRRELHDRFSGTRGSWVVVGYVAMLAIIMSLLYAAISSIVSFDFGASYASVGRSMFDNFIAIELGLVMFVGAGYAASQVANEREKRTLPLLQITRLTPLGIVAGKWWAVTAWQVLLLVIGMPLAAAAAFFGGVDLRDVLLATIHMVVVTATFSAVAIAVSSIMRRTTTAIVVTYGLLAALMVGPGVLAIVEFLVLEDVPTLSLFLHPMTGLAIAADTPLAASVPTVLTPFKMAYLEGLQGGVDPGVFPAEGGMVGVMAPDAAGVQNRLWLILGGQVLTCIAVTALALRVAAVRVRPGRGPRRRQSRNDAGADGGSRAPAAPPAPPTAAVAASDAPGPDMGGG